MKTKGETIRQLETACDVLRHALVRLLPHVRDPESAYAAGDDELDAIAEAERALKATARP